MANSKHTILIVEDESALSGALNAKLSDEGYSVSIAKNGKEGLELAMSGHPDMIILDLLMPVVDGMTMMGELRKDETWGKHVPVVILSNLAPSDPQVQSISRFEPAAHLVKADISLEHIISTVRSILKTFGS